jgi:hypothetical protein
MSRWGSMRTGFGIFCERDYPGVAGRMLPEWGEV